MPAQPGRLEPAVFGVPDVFGLTDVFDTRSVGVRRCAFLIVTFRTEAGRRVEGFPGARRRCPDGGPEAPPFTEDMTGRLSWQGTWRAEPRAEFQYAAPTGSGDEPYPLLASVTVNEPTAGVPARSIGVCLFRVRRRRICTVIGAAFDLHEHSSQ